MPTSYAVHRRIDAGPQRVWGLLTDGPAYPAWNPAVVSLKGEMAEGRRIEVVSAVSPKRTSTPTVTRFDAPRTMVWADGMPLGLFREIRIYTLTPRDDGTEFSMVEVFSGPLAGLMSKVVPDMTESFAQFADGLKEAAEKDPADD